MIFDKICIMFPTFGRYNTKLPTFLDSAVKKAADVRNICFCAVVNENDTQTFDYIVNTLDGVADYEILTESLEKPNLAQYFNLAYGESKFNKNETLVSMFGDDMEFKTDKWDEMVLTKSNYYNGIGIFYGDDCYIWHKNLCAHFFTSRKYVDAMKPYPFMCLDFVYDGIDKMHYEIATRLGRTFYLPELKIFHDHATRSGVDATFKRLRDQKACGWNDVEHGKYADECATTIRKNLVIEFETKIDVIMTTYNRTNLLEKTVMSYNNALNRPRTICVYDDCSEEIEEVSRLAGTLEGIRFYRGNHHLGVVAKTPLVLETMFENGSEAVVIIDSDCEFHERWWVRLNTLYNELKNDANFGAVSLLNAVNLKKKCNSDRLPGLVEKPIISACGALITKRFWKKCILRDQNGFKPAWDIDMCTEAARHGLKLYCTTPSFIQHIGYSEGSHASSISPTYAADYHGKSTRNVEESINMSRKNRAILYASMGDCGEIIQGSILTNMLQEDGYNVTWMTIPCFKDLVFALCPNQKVVMQNGIGNKTKESHTTIQEMRNWYPEFQYYINGQTKCPENHADFSRSNCCSIDWLWKNVCGIINKQLSKEWKKYLKLKTTKTIDIYPPQKPLAIIEMDGLGKEKAMSLYAEYQSKGYDARCLCETPPDKMSFRNRRENYLYGFDHVEKILLIKMASVFIGDDSAIAWATMFSDCKKIIYHDKRSYKITPKFSEIDTKAEDKKAELHQPKQNSLLFRPASLRLKSSIFKPQKGQYPVRVKPPFDVFICCAPKDEPKLKFCVENIRRNVAGFDAIYVITPKPVGRGARDPKIKYYCDKDVLNIDPMLWKHRPNWVYKQHINLFQNVTKQDSYYVCDADLIINKPLAIFNPNTGKPRFFLGKEQYHEPYFNFQNNMLGLRRVYEHSFIAEQMLMNKAVVRSMLRRYGATGVSFIEKSQNIIDHDCYIAEYELYGNYVMEYYPDLYEVVQLKCTYEGRRQNDPLIYSWKKDDIEVAVKSIQNLDIDMHALHSWCRNTHSWK